MKQSLIRPSQMAKPKSNKDMVKNRSYLPVTDRVAKRLSEAHTGHLTAEACKAVQPVGNGNTEECQSCDSKVLNQRDEFRWSWLREKWLVHQAVVLTEVSYFFNLFLNHRGQLYTPEHDKRSKWLIWFACQWFY